MLPVEINYENALETNSKGIITRKQAIEKLKENKELLDLEVITQEEYDVIKEDLTKYIK